MSDSIEQKVEINAPVARVWRALSDHREFGEWFRVAIDGPFVAGEVSTGRMTMSGYEHVKWQATVQRIEPEALFSFTWHPYALDPEVDYSKEPETLVEFTLEAKDGGTLLTVTETGFDAIPKGRRAEAFRMNARGWTQQMSNIKSHAENGR